MRQTVALRFVEGAASIEKNDIIFIESYRHRIVFHTSEGMYSIYMPLQEIEDMLDEDDFVRIHKSYIVSLNHVRSVSNYMLTLEDGTVFPVPRGRYKAVRECFKKVSGL